MNIIKLNAITSTNDYLKELIFTRYVESFTVVVAEHQTAGRGQMGAKWDSEPGKNLTFSVLLKDLIPEITGVFSLNVAVAISIVAALKRFGIADLSIKWPNDILTGNKKTGGILIENSIKAGGEIYSVIGIGINVNQRDFENLPRATSMAVAKGIDVNKYEVLAAVLEEMKPKISMVLHNNISGLWNEYHKVLFKKGIPMPFEKNGARFMAIIKGVKSNGNLELLLEDDTTKEFGIKDVAMLY